MGMTCCLLLWGSNTYTSLWKNSSQRKFKPKKAKISKEIRILHNKELSNLYRWPSIVRIVKYRRLQWAGHVARMRQKKNVYNVTVSKPLRKRPLGGARRRSEDNIKMDRKAIWRDLNWILCSAWKMWIGGTPSEHPPYSPDLAPRDFWALPTMKRELRGKKFRNDQRSAARFREVGGAL
jgi:hypothetical protein